MWARLQPASDFRSALGGAAARLTVLETALDAGVPEARQFALRAQPVLQRRSVPPPALLPIRIRQPRDLVMRRTRERRTRAATGVRHPAAPAAPARMHASTEMPHVVLTPMVYHNETLSHIAAGRREMVRLLANHA